MIPAHKHVIFNIFGTNCKNNTRRSLRRTPSPPPPTVDVTKTKAGSQSQQYNHFRSLCCDRTRYNFHQKHHHHHQKRSRQHTEWMHQQRKQQHKQQPMINTSQKRGMMMMMARSSVMDPSSDPSKNSDSKAMTFLVATLGYDERIAKGVIDALKQSGVATTDAALLSMVRSLAGRWEVDEDAGLEALVESVTLELARSEEKKIVTVWIVPSSAWPSKEGEENDDDNTKENGKTDLSRAFKVEGYEDMSLTDIAKFGDGSGAQVLSEMIECACSGIMACSTCHVVVANEWFDKVGKPSEAEMDMIDLAYNPKDTSRLGCQIILKPELNNAIFKIPRGANNMMDFIPFEDV